ncbi:MAG: phosphotransferase [Clostridiales bacterium]|nr:phosphotransferase [Clostridiales bacterium]
MNLIGKGNTAEIIEQNDSSVCKLFYEGYPYSAIMREYNNAVLVQSFNLPSPKVYNITTIENRTGIIYERLYGESILEKLFRGEYSDLLLKQITDLHKTILNCHTNKGMSYKEFLKSCIGERTNINAEIYNEINGLPEGTSLCHGDYHPGNIWINKSDQALIIDFMNVCTGPWQYDVARTYVLISEGPIPEEAPNKEEISNMQRILADTYLKNMKTTYNEISKYVSIIQKCRLYELELK